MTCSNPLNYHSKSLLYAIAMLLLPYCLASQSSKEAIYLETIHQSIERGTFKGFDCSQSIKPSTISRSRSSTCAEAFNRGYGTNCWNDTNTTPDPACVIPMVPAPSCNCLLYTSDAADE